MLLGMHKKSLTTICATINIVAIFCMNCITWCGGCGVFSSPMATCSSPFGAKHLDDMITCPQCAKVFSSARVLPCSHTLCLGCIEQHCIITENQYEHSWTYLGSGSYRAVFGRGIRGLTSQEVADPPPPEKVLQ